ncbi:MAG: type IV pilus modification protein PilV [SAR86 cluster bacterium]|uniref:Type IV pilus modification protein PilV n=1 Tax=SAR86 cluster bacterium TaxID=2030880 RepID=A0A2A5CGS8_9GAMM|nr:type IV pilus modification protein PilV [Gammaproteobacteria bacterium AH-315-E17]PCJ42596.1 MAG: type IV pilus modification protein PilV [SAR86 cluster bacterium]
MKMKGLKKGFYSPGFSLIEVLISLSILAAGLLGMTALQNEALQFNQAAFTDSQAQFLINDMVERIRANRGNNTYAIGFIENTPTASVNCEATTCTSNQMATWDIAQWRALVESTVASDGVTYLPSGESQILFNTTSQTYIVSVRYDWNQLGESELNNDGRRTISVTTRIQ